MLGVLLAELPVEEFQHHSLAKIRKCWVVPVSLIAHKSVRAVHLHPLEVSAGFLQPRFYTVAPFQRNVRILPPPEM